MSKNLITLDTSGQPVASSRDIAEHFGKEHRNVLRDIDDLKKDVLNFEQMFLSTEIPDNYGRPQRAYLMNRDGFTLLAMGFTGKAALEWKLKYIEAFNAMESELRSQQNQPRTLVEMFAMQAQINLESERKLHALEGKLNDTNKRFEAVATFVTSPLTEVDTWQERMTRHIRRAVEQFGLNYQKFHAQLYEELERAAGVDLQIRQTRLRKRMMDSGATKTECKNVSKLSIVAADKKLRAMFETLLRNEIVRLAASSSVNA